MRSPALFLALAVTLSHVNAAAQPTTEEGRVATTRFQEGVRAWKDGRTEAARIAFQQAYALRPTPAIAYNLGQVEFELGRYLAAAKHLDAFLRAENRPGPTRDEATKALTKSESHIGRFAVAVNVDGATVDIDREPVGKSPLDAVYLYVSPGEHTLRARKDGYRDALITRTVDAGTTARVELLMVSSVEPAASASSATPPPSAPSASSASGAPSAPFIPPRRGEPSSTPSVRTVVLAGGGAATVIATAIAIGAGIKASSADSERNAIRHRLGGTDLSACSETASADCAALADANAQHNSATNLMRGAAVGAGLLGLGTAITWAVWPSSSSSVRVSPRSDGVSTVGLWLSGEW